MEGNGKYIANSGYKGEPDTCVVINDKHCSVFKEFELGLRIAKRLNTGGSRVLTFLVTVSGMG